MSYQLEITSSEERTIHLPSHVIEEKQLKTNHEIEVVLGAYSTSLRLCAHSRKDNVILLSASEKKIFTLPTAIPFELTVKNNTIHLGHVIGILIRGKMEDLNKQKLNIYLNYVTAYERLNGLILLLTSDSINKGEAIIEGYAYNPKRQQFEKGVYPFPSALFTRKTLFRKQRLACEKLIPNRFFNSQVFNKWEMWEWLSKSEGIRPHLPETRLWENSSETEEFIKKCHSVYIKPISGMQGFGIYKVSLTEQEVRVEYRLKKRNITSAFDNLTAALSFIDMHLQERSYLVQQSIDVIKKDGSVIDFRVIVQKNSHGNWIVPGMITRFGEKKSIVSNISSGGHAEHTWDTLSRYFSNPQEAYQKYKQIEKLAITICSFLSAQGIHLGNVGLDIGMANDGKLWIIEMNNREPDMTIALDADDWALYYKLKTMPLYYAKWLSSSEGGAE